MSTDKKKLLKNASFLLDLAFIVNKVKLIIVTLQHLYMYIDYLNHYSKS